MELHAIITPDREGLVGEIGTLVAQTGVSMTSFHADRMGDGSARIQIGLGAASRAQMEAVQHLLKPVNDLRQISLCTPCAATRVVPGSVLAGALTNPHHLNPVVGEDFYGRKSDLSDLVANLRLTQPGQAVMVWEPRRIGKSSVLLELERRVLKKDYVCIRVDMQRHSGASVGKFLEAIASELVSRSGNALATMAKKRFSDPVTRLGDLVEGLGEYERRPLVLMIDEFQLLCGLRNDEYRREDMFFHLRGLIQSGSGPTLILSGGGVLALLKRYVGATSLVDVTVPQQICCLDEHAARQVITEPTKRIRYADAAVDRLLELTGCHHLVGLADKEGLSSIESSHVRALMKDWVPYQPEAYFEIAWGADTGIDYARLLRNKVAAFAVAQSAPGDEPVSTERLLATDVASLLGEENLCAALDDLRELQALESLGDSAHRLTFEICSHWLKENYSFKRADRDLSELRS